MTGYGVSLASAHASGSRVGPDPFSGFCGVVADPPLPVGAVGAVGSPVEPGAGVPDPPLSADGVDVLV
jgi:hypothetical protein